MLSNGIIVHEDVWPDGKGYEEILHEPELNLDHNDATVVVAQSDSSEFDLDDDDEDAVVIDGEMITERLPCKNSSVVSFATDLLSDFEAVKNRTNCNMKALDELESMLKARAALEDTYARGLEKIAQNFKDNVLSPGSCRDALSALKADLLNKADQHRHFSTQILSEVHAPLSDLKAEIVADIKASNTCVTKGTKNCRLLEEKYRKSHAKYHKAVREAIASEELLAAEERNAPKVRKISSSSSNASKNNSPDLVANKNAPRTPVHYSNTSSPALSIRSNNSTEQSASVMVTTRTGKALMDKYNRRHLTGGTKVGNTTFTGAILSKVMDSMPGMSNSGQKQIRRTSSSSKNISVPSRSQPSKSDAMINWLLPTGQQRLENLAESTKAAQKQAETSRTLCREAYQALCMQVRLTSHELQMALNKYQYTEEKVVAELQDSIRRNGVFESSMLANHQYDIQRLFKVMESIDGQKDLENFIRSRESAVQELTVVNGSTPFAEIGPEEAMDRASGAILRHVFNIFISTDLFGAIVVSDEDLLSLSSHSVANELPAPPPEKLIQPGSLIDELESTDHADELLSLLRLPLISKQDVLDAIEAEVTMPSSRSSPRDWEGNQKEVENIGQKCTATVGILPAEKIGELLDIVAKGHGKGRQILDTVTFQSSLDI